MVVNRELVKAQVVCSARHDFSGVDPLRPHPGMTLPQHGRITVCALMSTAKP